MSPNIIVTLGLIVLSIFNPKSKVICIIFFIFMWTLWGFNVWNGDYVAYMEDYNYSKFDSIEVGYQILCKLFSSWIPFQGFMIIISSFVLGFFCYWGIRFTAYPALYSFLYFPIFILDFVYLRNYICTVFIFLAFFKLIYGKGEIKTSICLILIASTIHIFSICYLPLALLLRSKFNYRSLIIIVVVFSALALITSQTILSTSTYLQSKANSYARIGGNAISLTTPFHILIVYISYYVYKKSDILGDIHKVLRYFMNFNILSMFMIPVYILLPYAASRSLRLLLVFNIFFYLSIFLFAQRKKKIYSRGGIVFIIIVTGYLFLGQTFDYVVEPLYYCNLLWGYNLAYQLIPY